MSKEDEDEVSSFEDDLQSQSSNYSGRNEPHTPFGTPKSKVSQSKRYSQTSIVLEENDESFENVKTNPDIEKLIKKVDILKSYLLLERKQRVIDKHKVSTSLKQFENLKKNYHEKSAQARKLEGENSSLKKQVAELEKQVAIGKNNEKDQNSFFNNVFGGSKTPEKSQIQKVTRKVLEEKYEKMERHVGYCTDQLQQLEQKHYATELCLNDLKNIYKVKSEELTTMIELNEEREEKMKIIDEENKRLTKLVQDTQEEKRKEVIETRLWQQRHSDILLKLDEQKKQVEQRDREIEELKIKLDLKNQVADSMAQKLLDLKSQLDSINLVMRKFSAKKIQKLLPKVDVEIILQKNPSTGEFNLFVNLGSGKHETYSLAHIRNVIPDEKNLDLFHIEYSNKTIISFESEQRNEIMNGIKDFQRLQEEGWWNKEKK